MLVSMTGFGSARGQVDGIDFDVEVRSVNNRYCKCVVKLPDAHSHIESKIEKLIRQQVSRGTVTLSVRMRVRDDAAAYDVNTPALKRYMDQLGDLDVGPNQGVSIDLGSILLLPGVCAPPSMDSLRERTASGLGELVERALEALMTMRREEGKVLAEDLRRHCRSIEAGVATVAAAAPEVLKLYHQRLTTRVEELMGDGWAKVDEQTLAREVAVFAERSDIAEEISRLTGHLAQFDQALAAEGPVGRKLDFIAQEMLREANTIASKAANAGIAHEVVDIKTAVDRIKEQVQNVE